MKLVYVCSPLRDNIQRNIRKANGYCRFATKQSVVPIAPHVMFTRFLDDDISEEREMGLVMGMEILKRCDEVWVFGDRLTKGMQAELLAAQQMKLPIRYFTDKCEWRDFNG
ncbi:MAG: hypothetical protein H6Q73_1795 [Firmicutes bacterium]|nr:hypothetical protein [Bacillota bacterium]